MSTPHFPSANKVYLQNNRSNVVPMGNIWSSTCLDLQSNVGVLRISPRLKIVTSTTDDADLGCPVAFRYFNSKIWAICDTHIFTNSGLPGDAFTDDATTGVQTDYNADESDMEVFNGTLCATTTDGLFSTDGSTWTQRDILSTGSSHIMTYFKKFDRLYYANLVCKIISINSSWVTADPGADYAINLSLNSSSDYEITSLRSSTNYIWIGSINNLSKGQPGNISQWDGVSATISQNFVLNNAQGCLALAINPVDDSPYAMDSNGILSAWNGNGFTEVGRLPFPFSQLPYNVADSDNERFIHPNGMYFTKNGTLRCVINNRANSGNVIENLPSGVWEWTKETGFVHIYSFTYNPVSSSTITDFGQNRISRVGAIASMNIPNTSTADGTFLVGATIYTDASSSKSAIFTDNSKDDVQKKGYFVIDWFESKNLADQWGTWWASYRKFLSATDSIVFKYRYFEETPVEGAITWVDTTHFTVANSAVVVSDYWTEGTGGEVEILRGTGGSSCAHIINAVLAGGTWTVTLDEVITGVTTGTATARFQKWIKLNPANPTDQLRAFNQWAINTDTTPRIQIKGCFTFTGIGEYYQGVLTSNEDIKTY